MITIIWLKSISPESLHNLQFKIQCQTHNFEDSHVKIPKQTEFQHIGKNVNIKTGSLESSYDDSNSFKVTFIHCFSLFTLCMYIRSSTDGQSEHLQLLSMEKLIPGLQPLLLWMANSIELLHFIQHEVPQLLPLRQDQEDEGGQKYSAVSQRLDLWCVCLF